MIEIATVDFTVNAPALGEDRLTTRANSLFDAWDAYLTTSLPLSDYSLRFELAEGSLKGRGRVAVVAAALYTGIATFGSFTSGVHEIASIARSAGDYLLREADQQLDRNRRMPLRGRKTAGQLAQLESLFVRVKRGELSPEQAMILADRLFETEEALPDGLRRDLRAAIREIRRPPKQLEFELEYPELTSAATPVQEPEQNRQPIAPPIPPLPPPSRFRVEVWRESKQERRHIHIESL